VKDLIKEPMKQFALIIVILFIAAAVYVFTLPPKHIALKDLHPAVVPDTNPEEPQTQNATINDSSETDRYNKVGVDYYIIVASTRNLTLAKQNAEKLRNHFNTDIILLPPTTEGNYRISCGKYSNHEEAKSSLKSIRTNISQDAWIFPVRK
jgi:hypothetical protein